MNKLFIIIIGGLLLGSCKDPYNIPLKDTDQSMLVVEGVLVLGADSTTISLSKSIKVNENAVYKAVPGAKLTVENKKWQQYCSHRNFRRPLYQSTKPNSRK